MPIRVGAAGRGGRVRDDRADTQSGNGHRGCKDLQLREASANSAHLNFCRGGEGVLPFVNGELGAEPEKMPCGNKGGEGGSIRVFKGDHEGGGGVGFVVRWLLHPRGELCNPKAAVGWVVTQECLMALFTGVGWRDVSDSSGNAVNEQFAPLDVRVGHQRGALREHGLDGRCDDVMGCLEFGEGSIWASENNQVTRGCPLRGRHLNVGVVSIRLQCLIACGYQGRGLGLGLGFEVCHERGVAKGDHKARPRGWLWFQCGSRRRSIGVWAGEMGRGRLLGQGYGDGGRWCQGRWCPCLSFPLLRSQGPWCSFCCCGTHPPSRRGGCGRCGIRCVRWASFLHGGWVRGGSSSNQGADGTGSPEGEYVGGGSTGGAAVLRVALRDAEREPMRSITTWRVSGGAVPAAEAAWMHRDRDLVRTLSWSW